MTERPILFSGPMVRALLAGWKTQTRRVVKPQPKGPFHSASGAWVDMDQARGTITDMRCPYGSPGDTLWVRETCRAKELTTAEAYASEEEYPPGLDGVFYVADNRFRPIENSIEASNRWGELNHYRGKRGANVPPIHMPRWASRITLRLTDARIEQLMDISADDAEAEGWPHRDTGGVGVPLRDAYPVGWYANLWEDINGRGSWEQNPWVWVLTFEVLKQDGAAAAREPHKLEVAGSNPAPASTSSDQLTPGQ